MGIVYKYKNDKTRYCFLDILAANNEYVNIIEVKGDYYSIDIPQIKLYTDLMRHILDAKSDKRIITSNFIIFNRPINFKFRNDNYRYILIDELKDKIKSNINLGDFFEQRSFYKNGNTID